LAGQPGFEFRYSRPWGEPCWRFRDIWLTHGATAYLLSFHTLPAASERYAEELDAILASFTFAE